MTDAGPVVVRDPEALGAVCAAWVAGALARAIADRGTGSVALAGGSAPRPVYQALAAAPLRDTVDWTRVQVFFGDERAVPESDPESNYRMAFDLMLRHLPLPATQVHRMEAERTDADAAAADYDRLLPASLDVLLLGMGPDGHTASLFPGSPALRETARRVVPVAGPKPPPRRLTITPPVIAAAREVAVIAPGAEKAAMVARAIEGDDEPSVLPARLARRGWWFLDPAAAARLKPGRASA